MLVEVVDMEGATSRSSRLGAWTYYVLGALASPEPRETDGGWVLLMASVRTTNLAITTGFDQVVAKDFFPGLTTSCSRVVVRPRT